ncbi:MAG: hypothetical protein K6B75_02570, partial [Lachnospiraceae bacterium]|nr:hypothetical protein [Lachnospiraceae bacterium]
EYKVSEINDELKEAFLEIMEIYKARIAAGESMSSFEGDGSNLTYGKRNLKKGNEDESYEQVYLDEAYKLSNGEYSDIFASEYGYYIVHMINTESLGAYDEAYEALKAQYIKEKYLEVMDNLLETKYELVENAKYWEKVKIGHTVVELDIDAVNANTASGS